VRDMRPPPLLERLFGVAVAVFVGALLIYIAVRLIEAVLPALVLMVLAGLLIGGVLLWFRSRQGGW
jgi:uncharacterized membrane protein